MKALGYIRQSRRADLDVALSYDTQVAAIKALAKRDGIDLADADILSDMGRSGGHGKERLREGYKTLVKAVDSGSVKTVYALSLTRLARSTRELYDFMELAASRKVRLVMSKEGTLDPGSPIGTAQFGLMSVLSQFERDLAVQRANDNVATRRANDLPMGRVPYGQRPGDDPAAVLAAWHETNSLDGAAKLLNARGVKSYLGRNWTGPSVRGVLVREVPGMMPRVPKRGVKPSSPFVFYRLLQCPCGRILTASRDGRGNREPIYRCHSATLTPGHQPVYRIRESLLMDAIKAEAACLRPPTSVELKGTEDARRAVSQRRERVIDSYVSGLIDKADRDRRLSQLEKDLEALQDASKVVAVPEGIDWANWSPGQVSAVLRAMFEVVELGADYQPVRFEWKVPAWRSEDRQEAVA